MDTATIGAAATVAVPVTMEAVVVHLMPVVAATAAAVLSWANNRKITNVHLQINSRMDELLAAAKAAALVEGRVEGRAMAAAETALKAEGAAAAALKPPEPVK
jgi:hypothetical protein